MIFTALHDAGLGMKMVHGDRLYEGLVVDGKQAILEMKNDGEPYWKEMEWPSYYLSYLLRKELRDRMQIVEKGRRRICFQGEHPWDVRVKAKESKDPRVILTDVKNTDMVFDDGNGFGLIVFFVMTEKDEDGTFRQWHEELKGGSSEYTKKIASEGRKPRIRKKSIYLISGEAWFFPDLESFRSGVEQGWLDEDFARTMRNSNERSRNPKYAINVSEIPNQFRVLRHYFNVDPDDFNEELFRED